MFKDFIMRKMLQTQLKGVPVAEQEKIIALIQKNPTFFQQLAEEIQEKVKGGMGQMQAAKEVVLRHQEELNNITK